MKLFRYSEDYKKSKLKDLVKKVFNSPKESTESCLKLIYKQLIKTCFDDPSKINELKEFMYSFTVTYFLYSQALDKSEEIFADLKEIKSVKISLKESETILSKGILDAMYKQNDIRGFKEFLKTFFLVAINAETPMKSTLELIKNYFQSFILDILQKASLKEVADILVELIEIKDLEIFSESESDCIILGIEYHIITLSSEEIEEADKIHLINMKNALISLFPSLRSTHVVLKIQRLLSPSQAIKLNPLKISEELLSTLIPGPVLETISNAKVSQTIQKYYATPNSKFQQIIMKFYNTPNDSYFSDKILKEAQVLESFKGIKGFIKILKFTKTWPFAFYLSACDRVSKNDLTLEHCHQIISTYLFLYSKKLRAKLPDCQFFYVNRKNRIVLSDFSFFNFPGSDFFSSQLDLFGNFNELSLVDFCFMQKSASIILSLAEKFDESSKLEISHRLIDFLFDKSLYYN